MLGCCRRARICRSRRKRWRMISRIHAGPHQLDGYLGLVAFVIAFGEVYGAHAAAAQFAHAACRDRPAEWVAALVPSNNDTTADFDLASTNPRSGGAITLQQRKQLAMDLGIVRRRIASPRRPLLEASPGPHETTHRPFATVRESCLWRRAHLPV